MRNPALAAAAGLAFFVAPALAAPLLPAIVEVKLENRGKDEVIVLLSRRSAVAPFYHASKLVPGARESVAVPGLPDLQAGVIRRSDVKRAQLAQEAPKHKDDDARHKRQALGLSLALALANKGGHDDKHKQEEGREEQSRQQQQQQHPQEQYDYGQHEEQQQQQQEQEARPREDGYGRPVDSSGRDVNPGTQHVIVTNMLGGTHTVEDREDAFPPDMSPPGAGTRLEAGQAAGTRVVNGVAIDIGTGNAAPTAPEPPPPASAPVATPEAPCYCGADMTGAYVEALQRAYDRIKALPNSETGAWDGIWFLSRNAGTLDERVRVVRTPGFDPNSDAGAGSGQLCPSGPCANLPGAGGGTMSLFGYCLPQHVGNDIMYGFVGELLGVPVAVQDLGGQYAQITSYGGLDPSQSRAAYAIGQAIANLDDADKPGAFTPGSVQPLFHEAIYVKTTPSLSLNEPNALKYILGVYPALANCPKCPDLKEGTMLRDWTKSSWQMSDGSRNYPPGYQPGDDERGEDDP